MRASALAALLLTAATAAPAFDGRVGALPGYQLAQAPAAPASAPASPTQLYERILPLLDLQGEPDDAARQALNESLWWVLHTDSGRDAAVWFLQAGASARLRMLPTGAVNAMFHGRPVIVGRHGYAQVGEERPTVVLSKEFLGIPENYRRREMAAVLAHELFGHVTEAFRMRRGGLHPRAANHYMGDELNARLLEWCVYVELRGPAANREMFFHLRDPRAHAWNMGLTRSYADLFTAAELASPVAVARERLRAIEGTEREDQDHRVEALRWLLVIRHQVEVHGVDPARFADLSESFDHAAGNGHNMRRRDAEGTAATLRSLIQQLERGDLGAILAEAARSRYVQSLEAQIAMLRTRLGLYVDGRGYEREVRRDGQIRLDELKRMHEEDLRNNPDHRDSRYWAR